MKTIRLFTATLILLLTTASEAASIYVAVASNFAKPMKALVDKYEQTHSDIIKLSFNSSGKFFAQIRHGAPYDLFFSADQIKPKKLEEFGLTQKNSRFTYATGRLALWSADTLAIDTQDGAFKALSLANPAFKKIAIANPKLAPYGLAATEVINEMGLLETLRPRLVRGENISQAYQFTLTGNAQVGFVALSQILSEGNIAKGSAWIIPEHLHQPIRQDAVIILRDRPAEAQLSVSQFVHFIQSPEAKNIIRNYGYRVN